MTPAAPVPETITLHAPFRLVKRGGRKEMQLPPHSRPQRNTDTTMINAVARAFRWQRMLESGECDSITELAEAEEINRSYVCRVLRLTLLAPEIVEAILDGQQPDELTLPALMKAVSMEWESQISRLGFEDGSRPTGFPFSDSPSLSLWRI